MEEKKCVDFRESLHQLKPAIDESFLFDDFRKYKKMDIAISKDQPKEQVCTSTTPVKEKSGKKGKRRLLKIISIIGLSGVTVLGSISYIVEMKKPVSLDESLAIETPKSLGISENTQVTLAELRSRTNKNLNGEEIIKLADDIIYFEKDIIGIPFTILDCICPSKFDFA